jgi:selenocysteine lyase/cysteine desulfurase
LRSTLWIVSIAILIECNANHEGAFATSIASDAVLDEAHQAMADFYNAPSPEEIVFGNNMTTLTLHISRSISREWKEGDEIVVTRLDHDANVTPLGPGCAGPWREGQLGGF